MVLTGKRALDYSGGVSAEDNLGIGGYERIMGPNGQAQYYAPRHRATPAASCCALRAHLRRAGRALPAARGRRPTRATATSACSPHAARTTRLRDGRRRLLGREQPRAQEALRHPRGHARGHRPGPRAARALGRHGGRRDRRRLGRAPRRLPVCLIGIESRPLPRLGFVPADGPEQWTAGTLFPQSSRRRWRGPSTPPAATGPLVVLANLSGFDGSPESMRQLQLEYGAEIGRAVVNFDGPDRLLRRLALPRRRVRRVLRTR